MCQPYCEHFQLHTILAIGLDWITMWKFHYSKYLIPLCKLTTSCCKTLTKPLAQNLADHFLTIPLQQRTVNANPPIKKIFLEKLRGNFVTSHDIHLNSYIVLTIFFIAKVFGVRNSCLLVEQRQWALQRPPKVFFSTYGTLESFVYSYLQKYVTLSSKQSNLPDTSRNQWLLLNLFSCPFGHLSSSHQLQCHSQTPCLLCE